MFATENIYDQLYTFTTQFRAKEKGCRMTSPNFKQPNTNEL